jgi:hypothetical protein
MARIDGTVAGCLVFTPRRRAEILERSPYRIPERMEEVKTSMKRPRSYPGPTRKESSVS